MSGWDDYKKAIEEAGEEYERGMTSSLEQYQSELNAVFSSPRINPVMGRVTTARALARFWSRINKTGMEMAAAEQRAFDDHIKPLRQVPEKE